MKKPPDLYSLQLFLTVMRLESFTLTANFHHVSISVVTKRMQELERRFDVKLFHRKSSGVTASSAARDLASYAREILDRIERYEQLLSEQAGDVVGTLRLGCSTTSMMSGLARNLQTFREQNPGIFIDLVEQNSARNLADLKMGHLDIVLAYSEFPRPEQVVCEHLASDVLCLVSRSDHPLSSRAQVAFEDTIGLVHIKVGEGSSTTHLLERQALDLRREIVFRWPARSYDAAFHMVEAGLGIVVLPLSAVRSHAKALGLSCTPLSNPWAVTQHYICWRFESITPVAATFRDFLLTSRS